VERLSAHAEQPCLLSRAQAHVVSMRHQEPKQKTGLLEVGVRLCSLSPDVAQDLAEERAPIRSTSAFLEQLGDPLLPV
jgi:hypothetical protein